MSLIDRRGFMSTVAVALPALAAPSVAFGRPAVGLPPVRALQFEHLHTGERLAVEYTAAGEYLPDALASVNQLLRDFRTGDVHPIDPTLLDLLHRLTRLTDTRRPFQVISGYRSPATNAMLRSKSEGVAAHSLHMDGMAIDIRLEDVPLTALRRAALEAAGGGVGFYRASNFVHVDTGRVRAW
jgi:uncharacterized protein YcbK (DUF882 family)